ncbi:MAG: GTP 3',8-cyclase MoaA [Coriobacteriia bacterium]|nr:GTP 3',8-cyclase MoaA [Coriobacteriia bacterium]
MKDSHGRTIDYMRISLTDRCNFRCIYCMPAEGVVPLGHRDILRFDELVDIVSVAAEMGVKRIRLTGGEPLVRKGVVDLVAAFNAIPGIEDISLTTNGVLLPKMAAGLKQAGLRRVNISLDTLDPEQFTYVTRVGNLQDTLDGIEAALEAGFNPVKINAVTVRSLNQDFFQFAKMSYDRPLHMRFIEYMPVGESSGGDGTGWGAKDVVPSEEVRERIDAAAQAEGIGALMPAEESRPIGGGPAEYYRFEGAQGTVGFISPLSRHFCSSCNRLRLSADGHLMPCLFSDEYFDIRHAAETHDRARIAQVINLAIGNKPDEHHDRVGTERGMSQIGG